MASNFQDTSSEDEIDVECTENEKELLDYVSDKYRVNQTIPINLISS